MKINYFSLKMHMKAQIALLICILFQKGNNLILWEKIDFFKKEEYNEKGKQITRVFHKYSKEKYNYNNFY